MRNKNGLNISSLVGNSGWSSVESIYYKHQEAFDEIAQNVFDKYKVSKQTARDAILYEIMSCQYGYKKKLRDRFLFKWFFVYIAVFIFIFISGVISLIIYLFKKKLNTEILYEEMWPKNSLYRRFYSYIDQKLDKNFERAILFITPGVDFLNKPIQAWEGQTINRRYANVFFDFMLSIKVILKDLFFVKKLLFLSRENNINFIYFYLRILRKLLMYSSQSSDIKAKLLISASDYYWNPLKYFFYKKNIDNIILIQHNYVNEYLHLRLFQYCDYYYAHSKQAIEKHALCGNAEFFNVGSFQLTPFLEKKDIEYDIAFISQTVYDIGLSVSDPDVNQKLLQKYYEKLKENFYDYLKNNPEKKAVYISKKGHESMNPTLSDKEYFNNLNNIEFYATAGRETFDLISKSNIVINMYSSVGFESYGLDKKVLWINYNRCCDIFKYDTETEDLHVMIDDDSYEAFSKRIELLLCDDINVINHYKKLKTYYMNIEENPAKIVADKIAILLTKK